jgi:hypothetical protein
MNLEKILKQNNLDFFEPLDLSFLQSEGFSKEKHVFIAKHLDFLKSWIADSKHGDMTYLERNEEARWNSKKILGTAQSAMCFLVPYFNPSALNLNPLKLSTQTENACGECFKVCSRQRLS